MSRIALEARRRIAAPMQAEGSSTLARHPGPDWALAVQTSPAGYPPLRFYLTHPGPQQRVTLMCQGLDRHAPAAMRTALALAVSLANRLHADLRLISTRQVIDPSALNALLHHLGLSVDGECILGGPVSPRSIQEFDRWDGELMLAASCQCATEALTELPPQDLLCLLHPGDPDLSDAASDPINAGALLARTDLRFLACAREFKQHLISRGFVHLAQQALSFEPPPEACAATPPSTATGRSTFLFEVVAPVDRQRFAIGLTAIEQALAQGVLDPLRWDFLFAAPGLPQVRLQHGQHPTSLDHLDAWAAWQARQRVVLTLRLPSPTAAAHGPPVVAADRAMVVVATADHTVDPLSAPAAGVIRCVLERDAMVQALHRAVQGLGDEALSARRDVAARPADNTRPGLAAVVEQLIAGR